MGNRMMVRIIPVVSSSILCIGYDERRRRILVQFKKGGGWYAYPAPRWKYFQLLKASRTGSVGKWVNTYLIQMPGQKAFRLSTFGEEDVSLVNNKEATDQ